MNDTVHILSSTKTISKLRHALEHCKKVASVVLEDEGVDRFIHIPDIMWIALKGVKKIAERALKATDTSTIPKAKAKKAKKKGKK